MRAATLCRNRSAASCPCCMTRCACCGACVLWLSPLLRPPSCGWAAGLAAGRAAWRGEHAQGSCPSCAPSTAHTAAQVPPMPAAQARAVIERELGAPLEALFEWIDLDTPLGSASISQASLWGLGGVRGLGRWYVGCVCRRRCSQRGDAGALQCPVCPPPLPILSRPGPSGPQGQAAVPGAAAPRPPLPAPRVGPAARRQPRLGRHCAQRAVSWLRRCAGARVRGGRQRAARPAWPEAWSEL